jgi:hypothetical protein
MNHALRVTLGLAVAGAIFGTLAGLAIAGVVILMLPATPPSMFVGIAALVGAGVGAVLFPTTGWMVMRHVPIGRALLGTFVGTVIGGVAGSAAFFYGKAPIHPVLMIGASALTGFVASVVLLRITAKRATKSDAAVDTPA